MVAILVTPSHAALPIEVLWRRQAMGYTHRITPNGERSLCGVRGVSMAPSETAKIDCPKCKVLEAAERPVR